MQVPGLAAVSAYAGSAALSSSNVAGSGMLIKSYPHDGSAPTGPPTWDDTEVTHTAIVHQFPGQPDEEATFVSGLSAPFMCEASGVVAFGVSGAIPLALQCGGLCQLYIYGASPLPKYMHTHACMAYTLAWGLCFRALAALSSQLAKLQAA